MAKKSTEGNEDDKYKSEESKKILERCTFPESVEAPFFFDLASDTPIQTVILDSVS